MLTQEADGRYVLDGRPIHAGDMLETRRGDRWEMVRFEWGHRDNGDLYGILYYSETNGRIMHGNESLRWPQV